MWSEELFAETTRRKLSSVYCLSAIRQTSGFRTASDEVANSVPIDILADKMSRIFSEHPEQIASIKTVE